MFCNFSNFAYRIVLLARKKFYIFPYRNGATHGTAHGTAGWFEYIARVSLLLPCAFAHLFASLMSKMQKFTRKHSNSNLCLHACIRSDMILVCFVIFVVVFFFAQVCYVLLAIAVRRKTIWKVVLSSRSETFTASTCFHAGSFVCARTHTHTHDEDM